ncbi:MAG: hypothetical protein HUN04_14155 [Desulfobacter sp.]|nr:MAG: hypothetical protein HUN04_14155 [Desulfobacter sp.]
MDNAYSNFRKQIGSDLGEKDFQGVLFYSDSDAGIKFSDLRNKDFERSHFRNWKFIETNEKRSIIAQSGTDKTLILIGGQQIVTNANIELLVIGPEINLPKDTQLLDQIKIVDRGGGIPIIPWGFGKWWGKRGKLVDQVITKKEEIRFFLGDNSGRLKYMPLPKQFLRAEYESIKILPGSDSLPFKKEVRKPGSFGFFLDGTLDKNRPYNSLKRKLYDPSTRLRTYGDKESLSNFIFNQLNMQIRKRLLKK